MSELRQTASFAGCSVSSYVMRRRGWSCHVTIVTSRQAVVAGSDMRIPWSSSHWLPYDLDQCNSLHAAGDVITATSQYRVITRRRRSTTTESSYSSVHLLRHSNSRRRNNQPNRSCVSCAQEVTVTEMIFKGHLVWIFKNSRWRTAAVLKPVKSPYLNEIHPILMKFGTQQQIWNSVTVTWPNMHFLSRVSVLTRDIDIAILSVCLSVRPSVTFRYCVETV